MPTYEYRCGSCTHQFEVFARMSDPDPEACEACGEQALEKVLFPVAVHYKGSGFYSTDYSGSRSGSSTDSTGAEPAATSGSSEGSSSVSGDSAGSASGSGSSSDGGSAAASTSGSSDA
jgi:putative FmdB family regulatory protein